MAKPRVHEIASEVGVPSKDAMRVLRLQGVFVKGPSSSMEPPVARRLKEALVRGDFNEPLFPGLTGEGGRTAAGFAAALPKRLPELVDVLISPKTASAPILDLIARAASDRHFFYAPVRAFEAAEVAGQAITQLSESELPTPRGIAVMIRPGIDAGAFLFAWDMAPETLDCVVTTLSVTSGSRRPSLNATSTLRTVLRRSDEGFVVSKAPRIRTLGGLWAILPERLPPMHSREFSTTKAPTLQTAQSTETRIIYATRSTLGLGSSSTGEGQARDTRWNVRGHYRNQYLPSTKDHRKIWIEEHTAGAADAEVIQREQVYVIAPRIES
ncbi:translation initiation factor IF-2 N-terminal domain-containing protein [Subtercola vilae]|uniref:Translation initiation factor IF-2 N-terminal domain-containing protein n=1 Tax=Subtercola vilae TaxID=2056433 RepID=A0A4T2BCA9_9MICO|nr:hypothetical protein D4765_18275 [Subtercola vilae]